MCVCGNVFLGVNPTCIPGSLLDMIRHELIFNVFTHVCVFPSCDAVVMICDSSLTGEKDEVA